MTIEKMKIQTLMPLDVFQRQAKYRTAWASETVQKMKFGATEHLTKATPEAAQIAAVCDHALRTTKQVIDRHFQVMADVTLPEAGRAVKSFRNAKAARHSVLEAGDRALAAFDSKAASLRSVLDRAMAPPSDAGTAMLLSEIRAHLRHQPGDVMVSLIKSNPTYARAVATAPKELTGAAPETYTTAREVWLTTAEPEAFAQQQDLVASLRSMQAALDAMDNDLDTFLDYSATEQMADRAEAAA